MSVEGTDSGNKLKQKKGPWILGERGRETGVKGGEGLWPVGTEGEGAGPAERRGWGKEWVCSIKRET